MHVKSQVSVPGQVVHPGMVTSGLSQVGELPGHVDDPGQVK